MTLFYRVPVLVVFVDRVPLIGLPVPVVRANGGAPLRFSRFEPGRRGGEGRGSAVEAVPWLLWATPTAAVEVWLRVRAIFMAKHRVGRC